MQSSSQQIGVKGLYAFILYYHRSMMNGYPYMRPLLEQLLNKVSADKSGAAGNEDAFILVKHVACPHLAVHSIMPLIFTAMLSASGQYAFSKTPLAVKIRGMME